MQPEDPDYLSVKVKELFGLDYLYPYQRLVITNILEANTASNDNDNDSDTEQSDKDCFGRQIVILPTGAGKSLCFQLPAILIKEITLVIYPILSLMADQERRLKERGLNPVILRGEQSNEERNGIWNKLKTGESKFIIANPEILLTAQVKEQLNLLPIKHIVIDEAHCVSEWGESFRPSYLELGSIINELYIKNNSLIVTAFTATASEAVLEKIKKYIFGEIDAHTIIGNPDRPNIYYTAKPCINKNLAARDLLLCNERPAIVFCSSRGGTEKLAKYLSNEFASMNKDWYNEIKFYHAGLSREEKKSIEEWFFKNPNAVLCATCAYGMGVDKADIRTVIHRDCPSTIEAYLQEAGRAGRDGNQSKAILLWDPNENSNEKSLSLINYAKNTTDCRRGALLKLLNYDSSGEVPEKLCCDVCEKEATDELREKKIIKNFFRKNNRRYTVNDASRIISKITCEQSINWTEEDAKLIINYLIETGELKKNQFPWSNKVSV